MSKKYLVILSTEFTAEIQSKLKNYGQNPDGLFIEDAPDTIRRMIRSDNLQEYVILKPIQQKIGQVMQLLPNHKENGGDKFMRIYNDPPWRNFLEQEFE